jgi:hypothetical protein
MSEYSGGSLQLLIPKERSLRFWQEKIFGLGFLRGIATPFEGASPRI